MNLPGPSMAASPSQTNPNKRRKDSHPTTSHQSSEQVITGQLKTRMLVSGEWMKLQKQLTQKLRGSAWEQSLRCEAERRALDQTPAPTLAELISHLRPLAQNSIPQEIKDDVTGAIAAFVDANLVLQDDAQDDEAQDI